MNYVLLFIIVLKTNTIIFALDEVTHTIEEGAWTFVKWRVLVDAKVIIRQASLPQLSG